MLEEMRRVALFTSGVAELTRHRAERMVKQWVKEGELRRDQTAQMVRSLLEISEHSRRELSALVRSEIRNQVEALGLASKRDVQRLARRLDRLEASSKRRAGSDRPGERGKAARKKAATRKKTNRSRSSE